MFRQNPRFAEEKTFADIGKALAVALLFGITWNSYVLVANC
jgi:hypothetical protein